MDPNATGHALAVFAAAVMAFTAGAYLARSRKRVRRVLKLLIALAILEAVYGLVENLTRHQHIFWIPVGGDFARGTFYNRNHFAATLSMFLPVMIGWFYFRAAAAKSRHERTHLLPATSWDILGTKHGLWLLAPAALVLAIIQSQSRGGFSSMILGVALMFAVGARRKTSRTIAWLTIPLALALFVYGINSDYQAVLDRFGKLVEKPAAEGRTTIWNDSLGIVRDYPVFGIGLGNFPRAYMQYASVSTLNYPYQAHNEWLEGLLTLGILGMVLVTCTFAAFLWKTFRQIRATGPDYPWLLGCWCGLVALAFHSFGEFNLHIPSIAVTSALFAGVLLGVGPAHRSAHSGSHQSERSGHSHRSHHRSREHHSSGPRKMKTFPMRAPVKADAEVTGETSPKTANAEESAKGDSVAASVGADSGLPE
ncbi:O-antigen ligase family protein, partial [Candidatus Sumerlaeota bacterium]|nr:O-antigen ligase family protein [Candidatus Sumerlaeota bacterium]